MKKKIQEPIKNWKTYIHIKLFRKKSKTFQDDMHNISKENPKDFSKKCKTIQDETSNADVSNDFSF